MEYAVEQIDTTIDAVMAWWIHDVIPRQTN